MPVAETPALLLRVYLTERMRSGGEPLHRRLVGLLRERGIWGATLTRALAGYGRDGSIHSARTLDLSMDLPLVLEAVDHEDRIRAVLPEVLALAGSGLVTLQPLTIVTSAEEPGP